MPPSRQGWGVSSAFRFSIPYWTTVYTYTVVRSEIFKRRSVYIHIIFYLLKWLGLMSSSTHKTWWRHFRTDLSHLSALLLVCNMFIFHTIVLFCVHSLKNQYFYYYTTFSDFQKSLIKKWVTSDIFKWLNLVEKFRKRVCLSPTPPPQYAYMIQNVGYNVISKRRLILDNVLTITIEE